MTEPPGGLVARHLAQDDAEAVVALIAACEAADLGRRRSISRTS